MIPQIEGILKQNVYLGIYLPFGIDQKLILSKKKMANINNITSKISKSVIVNIAMKKIYINQSIVVYNSYVDSNEAIKLA